MIKIAIIIFQTCYHLCYFSDPEGDSQFAYIYRFCLILVIYF